MVEKEMFLSPGNVITFVVLNRKHLNKKGHTHTHNPTIHAFTENCI